VGLALLVFVTYGLLHWQLLLVLLLSVPLGMGLYWQEAAKKPATSHSEQGIEAGSRG
jgi:chromate transporter